MLTSPALLTLHLDAMKAALLAAYLVSFFGVRVCGVLSSAHVQVRERFTAPSAFHVSDAFLKSKGVCSQYSLFDCSKADLSSIYHPLPLACTLIFCFVLVFWTVLA